MFHLLSHLFLSFLLTLCSFIAHLPIRHCQPSLPIRAACPLVNHFSLNGSVIDSIDLRILHCIIDANNVTYNSISNTMILYPYTLSYLCLTSRSSNLSLPLIQPTIFHEFTIHHFFFRSSISYSFSTPVSLVPREFPSHYLPTTFSLSSLLSLSCFSPSQ